MSNQSDESVLMSSNSYYRAGVLDTQRWAKIAEVPDYKAIISTFDWRSAFRSRKKKELVILDCGCGPGHFPRQLQLAGVVPDEMVFHYDTVDPSSYSLTAHRQDLQEPFKARNSYNISVQQIADHGLAGPYDLIWCMHSLYTVSVTELQGVLHALSKLMTKDGVCYIYLPTRASSYIELFNLYQSHKNPDAPWSYLTAEDVVAVLQEQPVRGLVTTPCSFVHTIPANEPDTLATYLNQICLRPDPLTAQQWQDDPAFASSLLGAFDPGLGAWQFQQHMRLVSFSPAR